jgi:ureidoacrylate peracid hydrolase
VDFQSTFAAPEGEHYASYKKIYEQTRMLENSVDLVKKGRALGIQIIQVMEGYSPDYRELDWSNPGFFHRSQILRKAWKAGTPGVELYEPLRPGPNDRDILLPNRITVSGFGGNGLDTILRSRGIKSIALGGFSTDGCVYGTLISAFDLGYHVYALRDAMASTATELSNLLLQQSYPKYSRVIGHKQFLEMVEKFPTPRRN